jgi:hypothetical protein
MDNPKENTPPVIAAPQFDESLIKGFERVASGAAGFARANVGDVIFGTVLGMHPALNCILAELAHPAVIHDGKPEESRKFWLAKTGDVVSVNLHYEVEPLLMMPEIVGHKVFLKCVSEEKIGGGKTLKHWDIRVPEGAPKPGLQTKKAGELPAKTESPNGAKAPQVEAAAAGRF